MKKKTKRILAGIAAFLIIVSCASFCTGCVKNKTASVSVEDTPSMFVEVERAGSWRIVYHKNTKDLAINQEDKIDWHKNFIPKGTVLYHNYPVISTDNQPDWTYEIKTTGDALSGDFDTIQNLLSNILYTIRTGGIR